MPLARRIVLLVGALLFFGGIAVALAFYASVKRALESEIQGRLDARMAWLEAALELEGSDLKLKAGDGPEGAAEDWSVTTTDGHVLWSSAAELKLGEMIRLSQRIRLGSPTGPLLEEVEQMLLEEDASKIYAGSEAGSKAEVEAGMVKHAYRLPMGAFRLELMFNVGTSLVEMQKELQRLTRAMLIVGPMSLLGSLLILSLMVTSQLKPLERMAKQADTIGPDRPGERIGPVGSSAECLRLRGAINSLVTRLIEGLQRERIFAASAAHELRTPLAQLRVDLEVTLRKERSGDTYRATMKDLLSDVDRLQKLVTALLQLTKSETIGAISRERVRLKNLLGKLESRHGQLHTNLSRSCKEWIFEVDAELLCAAISNILDNAARYAPQEPPLLELDEVDGKAQWVISDRGPGIPEGDREKIFHPLTRLDSARSIGKEVEGYGLGLSVARSLVRAFGGDLLCRARRDGQNGAEFVLSLPLSA